MAQLENAATTESRGGYCLVKAGGKLPGTNLVYRCLLCIIGTPSVAGRQPRSAGGPCICGYRQVNSSKPKESNLNISSSDPTPFIERTDSQEPIMISLQMVPTQIKQILISHVCGNKPLRQV